MGNLLTRRRELILASGALPEWDYEWDASKGLLNQNGNGFQYEAVGSGGYACSIVNDYLQFRGSSSNYKRYNYPTTYTTGVMEAEIYVTSNAVMIIQFSDGEHYIGAGLRSSSSYQGIYLGTGTTTKIVSASASTKYKVRLVLKSGLLGDVYVNDVLQEEDVDLTDYSGSVIRITGRGSGSGNVYSRLYSLKMKFNRTE